jgi:hypothetical protein
MGNRPAANPQYLKSGQFASYFWVVCFLLLTVVFWGAGSLLKHILQIKLFPLWYLLDTYAIVLSCVLWEWSPFNIRIRGLLENCIKIELLHICSFVHQCNTFTSYFLLIVDMFRPHTAIFKCYSILSGRWCSVMPMPCEAETCRRLIENKKWMCYIDRQKNKYSVLNECNRMLKCNILDCCV